MRLARAEAGRNARNVAGFRSGIRLWMIKYDITPKPNLSVSCRHDEGPKQKKPMCVKSCGQQGV